MNGKKRCEVCGNRHIISTNKDGKVCTYCKINRRKQVLEYLNNSTNASE